QILENSSIDCSDDQTDDENSRKDGEIRSFTRNYRPNSQVFIENIVDENEKIKNENEMQIRSGTKNPTEMFLGKICQSWFRVEFLSVKVIFKFLLSNFISNIFRMFHTNQSA
ncbi:MAG: hypothetical protein MHPSP_002945, partial [Paramarteilia canceri]